MKKSNLVIYCGALFCITAASIDIMLPVFHHMERGLQTSLELVQYSIPAFLFPFALMQMFYGPASDRFGRQPVLQVGLGLYILGSILVFCAPSISTVLLGRFIQGMGAASGQVIARAILRDRNSGAELAKAISFAMAIFSIAPILAPLIAYFISIFSGWRGVFFFLILFGTGLWLATRFLYMETNQNLNPNALQFSSIFSAVKMVLSNRQSFYFLWVAVLLNSSIILYVINIAPMLEIKYGITGLKFALIFAMTGLGIPLGQFLNHHAVDKFGVIKTMIFSSIFTVIVLSLLVGLSLLNLLSVVCFVTLVFLYCASFLVVLGNATSMVIEPHPKIAGLTSAFYGACTLLGSAISTTIFIPIVKGNIEIWTFVMLGYGLSSCLLLLFVLKKLKLS